MIACETKALADDILISGINSFIFSCLFALIWHTLGLVTFLLAPPRVGLARSNGYDQLAAIQGNPYRGYQRGGTT